MLIYKLLNIYALLIEKWMFLANLKFLGSVVYKIPFTYIISFNARTVLLCMWYSYLINEKKRAQWDWLVQNHTSKRSQSQDLHLGVLINIPLVCDILHSLFSVLTPHTTLGRGISIHRNKKTVESNSPDPFQNCVWNCCLSLC